MDDYKIKLLLRESANERDWDQFHSLKNLVCALSVEASELLEIFQWIDLADEKINDVALKEKISDEVADIMLYLIRFADKADINLEEACLKKIQKNSKKYPVDLAKGISKKYDEL